MSNETDGDPTPKIKRREFLSSAALPVAAALAPHVLSAQERAPGSAASDRIRIGVIGAGGIVSSTHLPGLRRMPGVEVVAVANRSLESSRRAAAELDIPRAYASWEQLLDAGGIDAVLIGTWPYMHRAITLAALDSGRHVLCQARMANDAAEAHDMLNASRRHPDLVCQLVPSSSGYSIDRAMQTILASGQLGDLLSVEVQRLQRGFANFGGELDWRHNPELSGYNVTTGLSRGNDTWIFGSEGTLHVDNALNIFVGRRGDRELAAYPNPPEGQARHRVEEEFINAIRGIEPVTQNTFEIGVRYMEWTEAIYRSARSGTAVSLPLAL